MDAQAIGAHAGISVSVWDIDDVDLTAAHPWPNALYVSHAGYAAAITGPRWLDLWRAAEQIIVESGETHFFIEGFEPIDDTTLDVHLGS